MVEKRPRLDRDDMSSKPLESEDGIRWLLRHHPLTPRQQTTAFTYGQLPPLPRMLGEQEIISRDTISAYDFRKSRQGQAFLADFATDEEQDEARNVMSQAKTLTDILVPYNMRLVAKVANEKKDKGLDFLDLLQEGSIGLRKAIDTYNPHHASRVREEATFGSYATILIQHSLDAGLERRWKGEGLPLHVYHAKKRYRQVVDSLHDELGRLPNKHETRSRIQELDIFAPEITEFLLMEYHTLLEPRSLNEPVTAADGEIRELHERVADPKVNTESSALASLTDDVNLLREALAALPGRTRTVILLRSDILNDHKTSLREVAKEIGVSHERVREIEAKGVYDIKRFISEKLGDTQPIQPFWTKEGKKSPFKAQKEEVRKRRKEQIQSLRNRNYSNKEISQITGIPPTTVATVANQLLAEHTITPTRVPLDTLRQQVESLIEAGKSDLEIAMRLNKDRATIRRAKRAIAMEKIRREHQVTLFIGPVIQPEPVSLTESEAQTS